MSEHAVVIAGGGPTGLMLAGELALAGIDVVIAERRNSQVVSGSRAGGLLSRTIEVLDQRGIADRFLSEGQVHPFQLFAMVTLNISDFPSRHNYILALWQSQFEPILADWVEELGVPILRSREVVGFTQDDQGVEVELCDDTLLRAQYLIGCDGGRSLIRTLAGIDFCGLEPTTSWIVAEVEMDEEPEAGMRYDNIGAHGLNRMGENGPIRLVLTEQNLRRHDNPSIDELREALEVVYGTDFGLRSAHWISRFTDMTRQAEVYRCDRVLLAGDAAHIHPPHGGQGLNTGIQDAVNLGWKLAQVVKKVSPDSLLNSYGAERYPVAARVLQNTMVQVLLNRGGERHQALRETMTELLCMEEPRKRIAGMLSGLDIHYDFGEGHPLLGRRMPDIEMQTSEGAMRVYSLLHSAQPLLLNFGEPDRLNIPDDQVRIVSAIYDGLWELPVLGEVTPPKAVLIRPDGYVAWVGDHVDSALSQACEKWFGIIL